MYILIYINTIISNIVIYRCIWSQSRECLSNNYFKKTIHSVLFKTWITFTFRQKFIISNRQCGTTRFYTNISFYKLWRKSPISLWHFFHPFIISSIHTFVKKSWNWLIWLEICYFDFYHKQAKVEKVLIGTNWPFYHNFEHEITVSI